MEKYNNLIDKIIIYSSGPNLARELTGDWYMGEALGAAILHSPRLDTNVISRKAGDNCLRLANEHILKAVKNYKRNKEDYENNIKSAIELLIKHVGFSNPNISNIPALEKSVEETLKARVYPIIDGQREIRKEERDIIIADIYNTYKDIFRQYTRRG